MATIWSALSLLEEEYGSQERGMPSCLRGLQTSQGFGYSKQYLENAAGAYLLFTCRC